VEEEWG
jgi:hypothetical protein